MAQVMFYKHVFAPKHYERLNVENLIFIVIGDCPNPKRWFGSGNLESDAEAFLDLFKTQYWPDPNIHIISYSQLGFSYDQNDAQWQYVL